MLEQAFMSLLAVIPSVKFSARVRSLMYVVRGEVYNFLVNLKHAYLCREPSALKSQPLFLLVFKSRRMRRFVTSYEGDLIA